MSAPQVKERPASMLRAMFAGLGSFLGVVDKVRNKSAASSPAEPETTAAPEATAEPEGTAGPEATPEPEAAAGPEAAAAPEATPEPETATAPETAAAPEAAAATEAGGALPVANYDELSVASLRARLRSLSVAQLTELLDYEKSHAARADIITMFERRIVKVQAES